MKSLFISKPLPIENLKDFNWSTEHQVSFCWSLAWSEIWYTAILLCMTKDVSMWIKVIFFRKYFSSDCQYSTLIKNGICNDESNNEDCNYDGGDCCGVCITKDHCSEGACIGGSPDIHASDGLANVLVGNGFCNDETNKEDCDYDGGDCCASNIFLQSYWVLVNLPSLFASIWADSVCIDCPGVQWWGPNMQYTIFRKIIVLNVHAMVSMTLFMRQFKSLTLSAGTPSRYTCTHYI